MSQNDQQTNQKLFEIQRRLEQDSAFRRQVERDPVTTLTAAGLPAEGIRIAGEASESAADVAGYMMSDGMPDKCICLWHNDLGECTVSWCP